MQFDQAALRGHGFEVQRAFGYGRLHFWGAKYRNHWMWHFGR
jgi:hypothetical protein